MAGPGAVPQLGYCVPEVRILVFLVRPGLEVTGVATRTVRLVGGKLPGNNLCIIGMTIDTGEVATMFAGVIRRHMPEIIGQPGDCRVAVSTVLAGQEMPIVPAVCNCAVMAADTVT